MTWYYNENGNSVTATFEEVVAKIQRGEIQRNTLVWNSGMSNWCEAKDAPGLMPHFNAAPPPMPQQPNFNNAPPPPPQQPNFNNAPPPPPHHYNNANNTQSDPNMIFSILSYLGLWWIGFLGTGKDDPNVRFHMGQGIVLSIAGVGLSIVISIFSAILQLIFSVNIWGVRVPSPWVITFSGLLWFGLSALLITLAVLGIISASKGERKPLPVIGQFAFYGKE